MSEPEPGAAAPGISLAQAQALIARGHAAAEAVGLRAVVAVHDAGATLIAFARMDGAWLASNELAQAKARASVMFQAPSEALGTPVQLGQPIPHFDHIHHGGLLLMGGGLPIFNPSGVLLGGIGVSGGTPEQDAELARAALV